MGAKTYIPMLIALVRGLCIYMTRWDSRIRRNLAGEALTTYGTLSDACRAFLAATSAIDLIDF